MSVVIVGGHDRMVQQYKQVCKAHRCKAKVFTKKSRKSRKPDRKSGCHHHFYKYRITSDGKICSDRSRKSKCRCNPLSYEQ